jgi:hypothetical protein
MAVLFYTKTTHSNQVSFTYAPYFYPPSAWLGLQHVVKGKLIIFFVPQCFVLRLLAGFDP